MERTVQALGCLLFILLVSGCTGVHTFNIAARPGDTVAVAIGITSGHEFIDKNDVTATLIDSVGTPHTVQVSQITRVYADPLSEAALKQASVIPGVSSPKYDGQWMALINLWEFVPGAPPNIPLMAPGDATLVLDHPNIAIYDPHIRILDTAIDGPGSPHPLDSLESGTGSVNQNLDAAPHIGVDVSGSAAPTVAGATFVIRYDPSKFPASDRPLRAVKLSQDPNIQMLSTTRNAGVGLKELVVIMINPHGFDASVLADYTEQGKSGFKDLGFVVTWATAATKSSWVPSLASDITLQSSDFIDLNGDALQGLTASFSGGYGYQ